MIQKILLTLGLVVILGLVSSPATAQTDSIGVRFIHALPNSGAVDIYVDADLVVAEADFGAATPHIAIPLGEHTIALRTAGTPASGAAIFSQTITLTTLRQGVYQTLLIQNSLSNTPEIAFIEDDLNPAQLGQARLHVIHAIAGAGPVDLIGTNGAPITQNVAFNTPTGTVNPPVSQWELVVVPNGGIPEEPLAEVGSVSFNTGLLYTVVVAGQATNPQAFIYATPLNADPAAQTVLVRFAHGSSDAPAVDLYANDIKIAVNIQPGQITPHVAVPIGDITLAVREAGSPPNGDPISTQTVTLNSSTGAATLVALGALADNSFTFSIYEDNPANIDTRLARVRVINTVPASIATVTLSNGTAVADGLSVFSAGETFDVPAGVLSATATLTTDTGELALELPEQWFVGGTHYTLLLYANASAGVSAGATPMNVSIDSLPGAQRNVAVVGVPNTAESTTTDTSTQTQDQNTTTTSATNITTTDTTSATNTTVQATPVPFNPPQQRFDNTVRATVNVNEGSNVQCREYPSSISSSLGLIPNNTTMEVRGYAGPPDDEQFEIIQFVPVDPEQFLEPTEAEEFEQIWLSVLWQTPDGGFIDCWVRADFMLIFFRDRLIDEVEEFFALEELDLPIPVIGPVPYNYPAEPVDTSIAPPTPQAASLPTATVNLDSGVNLHLRILPDATSESLVLIPNGSDTTIIERTASVEEITATPTPDGDDEDDEPIITETAWLYVEYVDTASGLVYRGWISSQYVLLSQGGRRLTLEDISIADVILLGERLGPATTTSTSNTAPPATTTSGPVVGTVNISPTANLNIYDIPSSNGNLVRSLTNGATVTVIGRNTDGSWLNVQYEVLGEGVWTGWVSNTGNWISIPIPVQNLPITG